MKCVPVRPIQWDPWLHVKYFASPREEVLLHAQHASKVNHPYLECVHSYTNESLLSSNIHLPERWCWMGGSALVFASSNLNRHCHLIILLHTVCSTHVYPFNDDHFIYLCPQHNSTAVNGDRSRQVSTLIYKCLLKESIYILLLLAFFLPSLLSPILRILSLSPKPFNAEHVFACVLPLLHNVLSILLLHPERKFTMLTGRKMLGQ